MQARIYSSASPFSSVFPLGFWPCGGLRLGLVRFFKPFRPLALAQQALVAIILKVLRRFRGAALFRGLRPSSSQGVPFWPSGLTLRSSRPAYGGRLIWAVSTTEIQLYFTHAFTNGNQFLKRCSALGLSFFWASPAGVVFCKRCAASVAQRFFAVSARRQIMATRFGFWF